jgi:hypothetical protein
VAETRKAAAAKAATEAKLALEPVSIYISRATRKLYVRRNTHKPAPDGGGEVFDASIEVPVTIRDPGKPIGTHVFTAVARDGAGLRWTAVTIDDGRRRKERARPHHHPAGCARPHRADRIAAILDHHLGRAAERETNYRTEFVAVLSNQPQGGFITRKPSGRSSNVAPKYLRSGLRTAYSARFSSAAGAPRPASPSGRGWELGAGGGAPHAGSQRGWGAQPGNPPWRRPLSSGATGLVRRRGTERVRPLWSSHGLENSKRTNGRGGPRAVVSN